MKKLSFVLAWVMMLFIAPQFLSAQIVKPKVFPTDQSLMNLAKEHVKTPIKKTTNSEGDVFLQRDLTRYLHSKSDKTAPIAKANRDHGHDHHDAMLLEFLNKAQPGVATFKKYFNQAAAEFQVPVEILMATAQVQSNWAQVSESMYGSWGVMGIIENHKTKQISKAASLLKVSVDEIKKDALTNIRAGAALLAEYQKKQPAALSLEGWFEALKELTGLSDPEMKHELALRILDVVKEGSKTVTLWNEIILINPVNVTLPAKFVRKEQSSSAKVASTDVDYSFAVPNFTTVNFGSRPPGSEHKYYYVHYVGTGTYQGAIDWFKDPASQVSAHYIVRNSDGQVSQVVSEENRAWSNGENDANNQGIATEHEAILTNLAMWDSEPMLTAAGHLAADVCDRNAIPKVRRAINGDRGIYGHSDIKSTDCPNLTPERWDALLAKITGAEAKAATPFLNSVTNSGAGNTVTVSWKKITQSILKGYRLYYANDDLLTSWSLAADETTLTPSITSATLNPSAFINVPTGDVYHFKLTSVVNDGGAADIESPAGDIYSRSSNTTGEKVLIVDGLYKSSGSYTSQYHSFVTNYFRALRDKGSFEISSASNERVEDGTFDLKNYALVVWFIGDESSSGVVLSATEKNAIKGYLDNGGKLLFSGSEAAYNLGRSTSAARDSAFLNNYFKSNYISDGASSYTPATGITGTAFEGLAMPFGITYVEDYPDAVKGVNGGVDILKYTAADERIGGVAYRGTFGTGSTFGAMVFLSFTLETATDATMASFMERMIQYFNEPITSLPPVANIDKVTTPSNNAIKINVLANDIENGSGIKPSSLAIVLNPANGTAIIEADRSITYTPANNFIGTDYFDYTVDNIFGQTSNVARVTVTVTAVVATVPFLNSVTNPGSGSTVKVTWKKNTQSNLVGYRLYYANDDLLTFWSLAADETTITSSMTSVTLDPSDFINVPTGDVYHFKLTSVVSNGANPGVESLQGDVYSRSSNTTGEKVLIVDGFYKSAGSYSKSTHSFVTNYFRALRDKGNFEISSASNERVEDGTFDLKNYDLVVWFVGDESSAGVILSTAEKNVIKAYLDNGGKLLFSGSEAAYNLGRSASASYDLAFMNNYFKSSYVSDGVVGYTPATGIAGTTFEGLTMPFGITYVEDFPDAIKGVNGGIDILKYNSAVERIGGVAYKGTFGSGTKNGAIVFLSFTLETALDNTMASFMEKMIQYFSAAIVTYPPTANPDSGTAQSMAAKRINVLSNDTENGSAIKPSSLTIVLSPASGSVSQDGEGNITYISNAGFTGTDFFDYTVDNEFDQASNVARVTITVVAASADCDPDAPETDDMHPKRDLRGAWVSTVSNIDWPSSRTLTTSQQQTSLIKILDTLAATGINTVFLQVRPEGDALYASSIEPWSYWLTNSQGTAPNPLWDPLEFAITEAHKRGMELHAWINPYRAKQSTPTLAANHAAVLHPDWTFLSGTATYFNPGIPAVRDHVTSVVVDIVSRYNIDGIHFDDYFYPYVGMTGQDDDTYATYNPNAIPNIADWRRYNVNTMIAKVYDAIAVINTNQKRNVIFGVSPFGIWKSGVPAGISGTSSYDAVYCDPIAWMQAGKVDYIAPQLYWKITGAQDYKSLSKWWNDQAKTYGRQVYPGLALYKMNDGNNWAATEIQNQIGINRSATHDVVKGQVMFSTQQIMANSKGLKTALQNGEYRYKSFSPAMPWKGTICPNPPTVVRISEELLEWNAPAPTVQGIVAKKYVVYRFVDQSESITNKNDGKKIYAITYDTKVAVASADQNSYFVVTALDNNNNESKGTRSYVLEVTGLDLKVKLTGSEVDVTWTTLSEINTNEFEVERSTDGNNFRKIAIKAAAGNNHSGRKYSIQDALNAPGVYYYRVKSIDIDGRTTISDVKHVIYENSNRQIQVGPNPFKNSLTISHLYEAKQIDLIDMTGRILLSRKVKNENTVTLETGQLPSGVYHLKISRTDGSFSNTKVVRL